MNTDNIKRFTLHVLFGALAAGATLLVSDVGSLNLDPTISGIVVLVGTAAASFFRGKAAQ